MTIIRDVSDTLKALILDNIQELKTDTVLFDSPAEVDGTTTSARLSMFLYQVAPNPFLRNQEPVYGAELNQRTYPPLPLDLHYLFTPYANNRETEFIILGSLMRTFHDNAIIREASLQGGLKESGNLEIKVVPNALSLDELNKLWGMFPNKGMKLSAAYLVTPVQIPSQKTEKFTRVLEKSMEISRID